MPEFPSGTVAFLFTDIEGSTKRWERDRDGMATAVERHFALLQDAIAASDGVLFKIIGDAVQAAFPTVPGAIAAAVAAQSALRAEDWGDLGQLRVRMAVHVGEATPRDGDYLAPCLNRLARLLGTGYGEQILLSEAAHAMAQPALPPGCDLLDLGSHRLRDLLQPEHIYQLTGPGLVVDFPPLKSLDRHLHNLPAQPTALLGRETEVAATRALLEQEGARIVTLTGPGGTGKTRLGLQVGAELVEAFGDGVWFVPLAAIADPDLVVPAIAQPLGVREIPGEPLLNTLQEYLKTKHALLLLDNFEHLTAAALAVSALIAACPGVQVLVTSRQPLRINGERELPVPPLTLPDPRQMRGMAPTALLEFPALRLFVERAQAVKPDFALSEGNAADVVAICRRLDGLPLAIELAAARVRVLPPAQLLVRLDHRLAILTGGARDLPARQQTLRATIAWSHDLLDRFEQTVFARLGVFSGGCSLEMAEAICSAAGGLEIDLFDGIESLVQKSLLRQEEGPGEEPRFTMLQGILEFAQERLQELPEAEAVFQAHADTFLALAENADWDEMSRQGELLDRLEADHANLRQAIEFYEGKGERGTGQRVRLASALAHFWWVRGHLTEGRRVLESAITAQGEIGASDRAAALSGAALLAEAQWELDRARELHLEALSLDRTTGDAKGAARSLTGLGLIARHGGDLDSARALHQEALDVWRATGDHAGTAGALLDLGAISHLRGDQRNAEPLLRQSLELFTKSHDAAGEATAHQWLGVVALAGGSLDTAATHFEESLKQWRRLGNQQMTAADLGNLGETHYLAGALADAEALYRESLKIYDSLGDPMGRGFVVSQLGRLALDRKQTEAAVTLLLDGLRLRWGAGDRGGAADTLDALAEAVVQTGDLDWARTIVVAGEALRAETGLARLPVYAARYAAVKDAIGEPRSGRSGSIDELVGKVLSERPVSLASVR